MEYELDCYWKVLFFEHSLSLFITYSNFADLDSLAGEIAYRHSDGFHPARPVTIVTASVDRIELVESILPFFDLKLVGRVTHTGKSSIEVRIDLFTNKDGEWRDVMVAIFAMV